VTSRSCDARGGEFHVRERVWDRLRACGADPSKPKSPIAQWQLFLAARQSADAKGFKQGLDFNLMRIKKV
jgi:hypothetical protein